MLLDYMFSRSDAKAEMRKSTKVETSDVDIKEDPLIIEPEKKNNDELPAICETDMLTLRRLRKVSKSQKSSSQLKNEDPIPQINPKIESYIAPLFLPCSSSSTIPVSEDERSTKGNLDDQTVSEHWILIGDIPETGLQSADREVQEFVEEEKRNLWDPFYLQKYDKKASGKPKVSNTEDCAVVFPVEKNEEEEEELQPLSANDVLLFHPIYSKYLPLLPMKNLLALAQVAQEFTRIVNFEKARPTRHRFQWIYRKEFIRYLNLSYASQNWITPEQIFGNIVRDLYILPEQVLVFYSPDIFQYDVRVGYMQVAKPDRLLDNFMRQKDKDDLRVWHFRLFSVIRPESGADQLASYSHLTAHELNRMYIWHSEDLVMIFLPSMPNIRVTHQQFNYSTLLDIGRFRRDRLGQINLSPFLVVIEQKYYPKFLILSVRDIQQVSGDLVYQYPIIVFESRTFEGDFLEEFICFSGEMTVYQVVLDVKDRRVERDEKLNALHVQLGVTFPSDRACWLFYFTEMWPGGASREIPQCDMIVLRNLFPGVPVFGGRAKRFAGNQILPILESSTNDITHCVQVRTTPTIVTAVAFGRSS